MNLEKILSLRSIQLARLAKSSTHSNPKVGSIIFDQTGKIASEGYHKNYGGPHAEVNAIDNLLFEDKNLTEKLSILVSLEPCNHFGKTPPCVDLIKKHKFKSSIVACVDPDPRMSGKSINLLNEAGINTQLLSDADSENKFLKTFITNINKKRPYIYLKVAMDKEGIIGDSNKRIQITDKVSQFFGHKIRSEVNAILVGRKTAELDNPSLSTRMAGGESPLRVVIDLHNKLSSNLGIFNDQNKTLYICGKQRNDLGNKTEVFVTNLVGENLLHDLLRFLYEKKNIGSILIEGGAETIKSFIKHNLWDELLVFQSGKTVKTPSPVHFSLPECQLKESVDLKSDKLSIYTPLK